MNKTKLFLSATILACVLSLNAQQRKNIYIPDILGFKTLKCDFHMHTVFSDGLVWPTIRVAEAWLEGLDAISITDHIEYLPHSKDIPADHNRSYDIAKPIADRQGLILVKGSEITRGMPPGHLNVLFITNANLLVQEDFFDAIKEAGDQGAFIFWNHPGWKAQQPDTTLWWDEHTRLLEAGLLHGIEVYNSNEFYPEALTWSKEKSLTILCNSDVHNPINMSYDLSGSHRPMTLVFAKEKSEQALKEALFQKRSVAYFGNTLMGPAEFLEPLFFASVELGENLVTLTNNKAGSSIIRNHSDVDFELELAHPPVGFSCTEKLIVEAHHSASIEFTGNSDEVGEMDFLKVQYRINNLVEQRGESLIVTLIFKNTE